MNKKRALFIVSILIGTFAVVALTIHHHRVVTPLVKPAEVAQVIAKPATRRSSATLPSYMDLIRSENPAVATTQPLAFAVDLPDAAHLIVHDPAYLDLAGHLWFTRSDGEVTSKALRRPSDASEHVIRDAPVFVHWWTTDAGDWAAAVVVRTTDGYDIITKADRRHLAGDRHFRWQSAFSIIGKIVVPTDVGMGVFDIDPKIVEHYHPLPGCTPAGNPPVAIADTRGILAWAPWERGHPGSGGVSRFVDGNWVDLPTDQWPTRPIQLSILLDGSVLRLAATGPVTTAPSTAPSQDGAVTTSQDTSDISFPDQINISIGQLEPPQIDDKHVTLLIAQLDDPDGDLRDAAFEELSRYGPGLSSMLEKIVDQQRPEGRMRIRQLLRNKLTPALGGLMPVDRRLVVARRYADGTVLFFAPAGVQIPSEHDEPDVVNPAWITQRPDGRMERPLPASLVRDQNPESPSLLPIKDEWLVCDEAGPRRFFGNDLEPLLLPSELRFSEVVGLALHRKWVFREARKAGVSEGGASLIIDPLIADPTPKLPVWTIAITKGTAGWDAQNFPAILRFDGASNWELSDDSWKQLPAAFKVHTAVIYKTEGSDAIVNPTTASTTKQLSLGPELLNTADGTRYYNGRDSLVVVNALGLQTRWPLPATAVGTADPVLVQTPDKLLFLYNQSGRFLRIRQTPQAAEPFVIEATFTTDIPSGENPVRIWLDPAGRIDWIADGKTLSVMFPSGRIPKPIANMMLEVRP